MARELAPGVITEIMARIVAQVAVRGEAALTTTALAIERQAKTNASHGEHSYRTPTPAARGTGPARISGTLVRSITHTEVRPGFGGWEVRVGLAPGLYPRYGSRTSRTPSSKYGMYLERDKGFPFLSPAVTFASSIVVRSVFLTAFSAAWHV